MSKFKIIALMLVVSVLASGCFIFKKEDNIVPEGIEPKTESVSDNDDGSLTYVNETDGYSVVVPGDWEFSGGRLFSAALAENKDQADAPYSLLILTDAPYTSVDEYLQEQQRCIANAVPVTIGDIQALRYINPCTAPNPNPLMTVMVVNDQLIVAISYDTEIDPPTLDGILESFQFNQ